MKKEDRKTAYLQRLFQKSPQRIFKGLTPAQRLKLQTAFIESFDKNNLLSEEDANEMIQSWLNKQPTRRVVC
ncbi:MAG: hypothetical protein IPM82_03525 [Saprospiraceae bacterium]|nr:hypothetical protein [Saprospiraceae bacterium]